MTPREDGDMNPYINAAFVDVSFFKYNLVKQQLIVKVLNFILKHANILEIGTRYDKAIVVLSLFKTTPDKRDHFKINANTIKLCSAGLQEDR